MELSTDGREPMGGDWWRVGNEYRDYVCNFQYESR